MNSISQYQGFLATKAQSNDGYGFDPVWMPDFLFDFQRLLTDWAIRRGRAAIFSDCFLPGTLIKSNDSYIPIEQCAVGMKIETLLGDSFIEQTMSRNYTGKVVTIQTASGFFPISVTPNHKFYVLRRNKCHNLYRKNSQCSPMCERICGNRLHERYKIELVQADHLTTDDCLLFRQPIERQGAVDREDAYLRMAGYWVAEGNLSTAPSNGKMYGIHFGLNLNEEGTLGANILSDLAILGVKATLYHNKAKHNVLVISASNHELAKRLKNDFGEYSHGKKLPLWFYDLAESKQIIFLRALFEGDAHIRDTAVPQEKDNRNSECIRFVTVSYALAAGVRDALLGLGIRCSSIIEKARIDSNGVNHRECYRIIIPRRFMARLGYPVKVKRRDLRQVEHSENGEMYTLIPIRKIQEDDYSGLVYNLTSAGHDSYLTDAGTSKNCGTGKAIMALVWAENVIRKTNAKVLIITPIAVGAQMMEEAAKFGIEAQVSRDGKPKAAITITNYERLHLFDQSDYVGCVCDESSAIKSFNGKHRAIVTEFMRQLKYRLLCTATAAPNDYIELGTSSEALGEMGYTDMLNRFFKNDESNSGTGRMFGKGRQWRFKGHAEIPFWQWMATWARAMRKPSDYGFDDAAFSLPEKIEQEHIVKARTIADGFLFEMPAKGLDEEREEQRRTLTERCEKVAELANTRNPVVVWCNLNPEGDLLARLLPDLVQVSGADSIEAKEESFTAFRKGQIRGIITKPRVGAWGMNWQHCSHTILFPTHSYEALYQLERRFWRFGQAQKVIVDIVTTESGHDIMQNLQRKASQADRMFTELIHHMNAARKINKVEANTKMEIPKWLF